MLDDRSRDLDAATNRDIDYFKRRELEELRMAYRARCERARHAHRELAGLYGGRRAELAPDLPALPTNRSSFRVWLDRVCTWAP
jgi:hypothetical protein